MAEPTPPAAEPFAPQATQVLPSVDQAAAPQVPAAIAPTGPAGPAGPGAPEGPAYGAPNGDPQQLGAQPPMNTLAIVAFVGSFFVGLVGIICGHISLKQIKRDGTRGRGFALAGTIIGYVVTVVTLISVILVIVAAIAAAGLATTAATEFEQQLESQSGDTSSELEESTTPDGGASSDVSPEFCTALEESASISLDDPAGIAAAYERLAENAPSAESAELYAKLAELTLDPSAAVDDPNFDITAFQDELTKALMADAAGCI